MEITIKESTMVYPALKTPKRNIWICNMDLVMTRYPVFTVYFYKPDGSSNFFEAEVLKTALSEILVPFYPLAGRLQNDKDGRLEITCNERGALFIEAETTSAIDDLIGDFTDSSKVPQLAPTVDCSGGISSFPVLALQVTRFKCGGVSIGSAIQHTLADGTSALHFINCWADKARGLPLKVPPFLDRTLLRAQQPPTPTFHHVEYKRPPPMKNSVSTEPKPTIVSVFKITADQLNTLKAKITANDNTTTTTKYSSYSILTAHIWRCVTKARGLADDQVVKLYMPIDGRLRLDPPLPPGYFGNVIFHATPVVRAGDLVSEPILVTIKRINEHLKKMNDGYLKSAIDYIETIDDIKPVVLGQHMQCPNLSINSWVRLPVHEADFGWGRPTYMRPAKIVVEGTVFILPSPNDDGSLSVVARLEESPMKVFGKLVYQF